jgi:hypothetical protein
MPAANHVRVDVHSLCCRRGWLDAAGGNIATILVDVLHLQAMNAIAGSCRCNRRIVDARMLGATMLQQT